MKVLRKYDFSELFIEISEHVVERWRERVDDTMECKKDILKFVQECASKKDGIWHLGNGFYLLDDDVVIYIPPKEKYKFIKIATVYGRVSENPVLLNINKLQKKLYKYGKVNLSLR